MSVESSLKPITNTRLERVLSLGLVTWVLSADTDTANMTSQD